MTFPLLFGLAFDLEWWEQVSTWLPANVWAWSASLSFWGAWALVLLPGILRWRRAGWHQGLAATGFTIFLLTLPALVGVHTRSKIGVILGESIPLRQTPTREAQVLSRLQAGETARYLFSRRDYVFIRTRGDERGWIEKSQFGFLDLQDSRRKAAPDQQRSSWSLSRDE